MPQRFLKFRVLPSCNFSGAIRPGFYLFQFCNCFGYKSTTMDAANFAVNLMNSTIGCRIELGCPQHPFSDSFCEVGSPPYLGDKLPQVTKFTPSKTKFHTKRKKLQLNLLSSP